MAGHAVGVDTDVAQEADAECTLVLTVARARRLGSTDLNGKADPFARVWLCTPPNGAARAALVEALAEHDAEVAAAALAAERSERSLSGDAGRDGDEGSGRSVGGGGSELLLGPPPSAECVRAALGLVHKRGGLLRQAGWKRERIGQTPVCDKTLSPVWNARFEVKMQVRDVVVVEVWDYERITFNDFLGGCVVLPEWYLSPRKQPGHAEVVAGMGRIGWALTRRRADWYQLQPRGGKKKRHARCGDVLLQGRISRLAMHKLAPDVVRGAAFERPKVVERRKSVEDLARTLSGLRGVHIELDDAAVSAMSGHTANGGHVARGGAGGELDRTEGGAVTGEASVSLTERLRAAKAGKVSVADASGGITKDLPPQRLSRSDDAVRIEVQPHAHTKFCDRSFRVCTADGKLMEGETVKAVVGRGMPAGAKVRWMRTAKDAGPDGEYSECPPSEGEVDYLGATGSHDKGQALSSVAGALAYVSQAVRDCDASVDSRYLTRLDAGCCLKAVVDVAGQEEPLESAVVGPVHPAHPFVRRIDIEGEMRVGHVLTASISYFGGEPGACEFAWLRITPDGGRETGKSASVNPALPLPAIDDVDAVAADPRMLLLTEEHVGSRFKVQCTAVRADGERGQPGGHTSKPKGPVLAADA
uniref:C2 domain-containing protein n=1 Tax=Bicosoecida sp. CB-2014 TaxID=1486930 RepID=A0A7S1G7L0_9STRA|mmetsp:Transcript_22419/g.78575  ORF Transcript_22419/g.78575 Transcript_22419/m.78575 type:complete len:645 (+) Transcript_22419:114-2048(+)|eukprot:CAMPEP_0203826988 /NCGR_PEP_ID=MMETSP0115-20131106/57841_1 /ASSEMBLY_ACC=CAM_ASM_000227 /TAXON_ID=33651 /ORGANISM="Bicosoecid sp, Strain ms1" /LENGTH=644 /DNA_ID=CAMNT_0050736043 /DNA_START=54 /DNA_END=1988 /DNA_ORIENTATION=+